MYRTIILDTFAREGLELLEQAENIEYEVRTGLQGEALRSALLEYDGAICRSGVKITAETLEGNRRLKAIVRAGVGTDNIDKTAATRRGIVVMNTPAGNTISTAEHTFALMLGLSRNIVPAHQSLTEGRWERNAYIGSQLAGKTLGIIGLGRVGQGVARRALAFEMRVIGYDSFVSAEQVSRLGVEYSDDIRQMLPRVDYLTVHTPLTAETRGLISHAEIELLKPDARLINCARGGIYDEEAMLEGLKSGKLGGVALDVYEHEPCTDHPLFQTPNTLCTPHLGASTEEAQIYVAIEAAEQLVVFLTTGEVRHAVNAASIDPKVLRSMRGYLDVAYRLGVLLAQWHSGGASECRVNYMGQVTREDTRLLTAAFCAGLLDQALDEEVNIVNAEILLRERGIELAEGSWSEPGPFSSSMTAELECDGTTYLAGGTLFGNDMPRLIRLGEYRMEAYLDGNLLIFTYDDVPGVIGSVGTTFGAHHVNIAQMATGRTGDEPGGAAIGVLSLDSIPPSEAIDEVLQIHGVHSVKFMQLPVAGQLPSWLRI